MKSDNSGIGSTSAAPGNPAGESAPPRSGEKRFWLEYLGRELELRQGVVLIGRSSSCHIALDDALVSRRHAELHVMRFGVSIRDLGSSNGVFVNERRINEVCTLAPGDRIVVGKQELFFRSGPFPKAGEPSPSWQQRFAAETLHGLDPVALAEEEAKAETTSTHQGDALELLGSVADKVLALGRGAEAERVLSGCLLGIMDAARGGSSTPASTERAVLYAIKIASATGKSRWVDYAFELYRVLRRPLPAEAVDQLYTVLRAVPGVSLQGLRDYLAVLRGLQRQFGPSERFLLQRIEGLERLAALK